MPHTTLNGAQIAYSVQGAGEPLLLLHPGFIADAFAPMLSDPALARYQRITYHRRGYGQSSRRQGPPLSYAAQAADARALLSHLGIDRAHIAGHSMGGSVAIQFALDYPEAVQTLTLLEPPIPGIPSDPAAVEYFQTAAVESFARYTAGDKTGAVHRFCTGAFQPGYRAALDAAIPGAFAQAVTDADAPFAGELPALLEWTFTHEEAARITCPVLSVYHDDALWSGFTETHLALLSWFPTIESALIPDATHLLQIQNPRAVAGALAAFVARHPLPVAA